MTSNEHIEKTNYHLRMMPRIRTSLFFACCAERFFPLYAAFVDAEQWGSEKIVRNFLNLAWDCGIQNLERGVAQVALDTLLNQTPHADDFESVETTFAQNVCLLISTALSYAAGVVDDDPPPLDAAFETLRVAHCVESTGFLDLGDDPRAVALDTEFVSGRSFLQEVSFQEEDLQEILQVARIDEKIILKLRNRAARNRYSVILLLPTNAAIQRH